MTLEHVAIWTNQLENLKDEFGALDVNNTELRCIRIAI